MSAPHEKELSTLERLLASLPPRAATLNRDFLLFRAGQASMRRSWLWPGAAVASSVAACSLALVLVLRPLPEPIIKVVQVQVAAPGPVPVKDDPEPAQPTTNLLPAAESSSSTLSYWRMQQQALRFGVEELPSTAGEGTDGPHRAAADGPDLSVGSRPKLIDASSFPFGEP